MYNFDKVINRKKTCSVKWSQKAMEETFNNPNCLPLWIADMDFEAPEPIKKALRNVIDLGVFGYAQSDIANRALTNWLKRRHNWEIDKEWIVNTPGIVFAINAAVQLYTLPGDKILIQQPVYYPFTNAIVNNGRNVVSNCLVNNGDTFEIDLEDFEEKVSDPDVTLFILCSPHNPAGKIHSKEELEKMLYLCKKYNVLVFADEIHNDLIMPGYEFVTSGLVNMEYNDNLIVAMSPSKTFNLAGLQWSGIIIQNPKIRRQFIRFMQSLGCKIHNELSFVGVEVAYNKCEDWADSLIEYIYQNYLYLKDRFKNELPNVIVTELQATFLPLLDFSSYGLTRDELDKRMFEDAGVALDSGHWFGCQAENFMRINIACPRETLKTAIDLIIEEFKEK